MNFVGSLVPKFVAEAALKCTGEELRFKPTRMKIVKMTTINIPDIL